MMSIVVPCFNERGNVEPLLRELESVLGGWAEPYEMLFVDDGSTDGTAEEILKWQKEFLHLRLVRSARRRGKTAALRVGFQNSRGESIVMMDADLQYDPADILRLLEELQNGWDVVSGWRVRRMDSLGRILQARCFHAGVRFLFGVIFQDMGSGLKIYRRAVLDAILWRERPHQYALLLAQRRGFRVTEVPVGHRPRRWGSPKYGWGRLLTVPLDLARIYFRKTDKRRF